MTIFPAKKAALDTKERVIRYEVGPEPIVVSRQLGTSYKALLYRGPHNSTYNWIWGPILQNIGGLPVK